MGYRDQHRIPDSEGAWEIVHDDGEVLQFDPVDYDKKALFDFFRYQLDPVGSFYRYARPGCLYTS